MDMKAAAAAAAVVAASDVSCYSHKYQIH